MYTRENIIIAIMHCGGSKAMEFRSKSGIKQHDTTMTKKQSVTTKIMKLFSNVKILLQHSVLSKKIDLYFLEHKLAIEVDEKGHTDRDVHKEIERQKATEKNLVVNLLESIPTEKIMMSMFNLIIYTITLMNQMID